MTSKQKMELIPIAVFEPGEVPADPPRYFRVGASFHGRPDEGEPTLVVSLKIATKHVDDLEMESGPRLQLAKLLSLRGESETIDALDEIDIVAHRAFARAFWQAVTEREDASLGESLRPVASSPSTEPHSDTTSEPASA